MSHRSARHACAAIKHWADNASGEARRLQHAGVISDHQADTLIGLIREVEEDVIAANECPVDGRRSIDVAKSIAALGGIAGGRAP